jgi:hypothetical protein
MTGRTIDKIAWILLDGGRILSTRSRGKDVYYLPGGKREPGESDVRTLVREVRRSWPSTSCRRRPPTSAPGRRRRTGTRAASPSG